MGNCGLLMASLGSSLGIFFVGRINFSSERRISAASSRGNGGWGGGGGVDLENFLSLWLAKYSPPRHTDRAGKWLWI